MNQLQLCINVKKCIIQKICITGKKEKKKVILFKHCYWNIMLCGSTAKHWQWICCCTLVLWTHFSALLFDQKPYENGYSDIFQHWYWTILNLNKLAVYWPHWHLLAFLKSDVFAISVILCTFQSAPSSMIWSILTEPSRFTAVVFAFSFDIKCFIWLWNSPSIWNTQKCSEDI